MITYHAIRARQSCEMYGELFNSFYEKYNEILPTLDNWTEQERAMLTSIINSSERTIVECAEEMVGLEGDPRSIVVRKHMLRAITMTRLAIRYLNNTDEKYNPNALVSAQ